MCDNMYGLASVVYQKGIYYEVVVYKVDYTDVKGHLQVKESIFRLHRIMNIS